MIYQLVAIKDQALNAYQEAFSTRALPQAIRAFNDAVNTRGNPMNSHSADYSLWHVGQFDDETGIVSAVTPTQIATGTSLKLNAGISMTGGITNIG